MRARATPLFSAMRRRPALFVVLAGLALAMRLLFPPGFMPGANLSVPIVICTGTGPMTMMMPMDHEPSKAPKDHGDHACPFSGHAAPPLPVFVQHLAAEAFAFAPDIMMRELDLIPGRSLAAPPPPSHAPPATLV